jgi:hypothetical protein
LLKVDNLDMSILSRWIVQDERQDEKWFLGKLSRMKGLYKTC